MIAPAVAKDNSVFFFHEFRPPLIYINSIISIFKAKEKVIPFIKKDRNIILNPLRMRDVKKKYVFRKDDLFIMKNTRSWRVFFILFKK